MQYFKFYLPLKMQRNVCVEAPYVGKAKTKNKARLKIIRKCIQFLQKKT